MSSDRLLKFQQQNSGDSTQDQQFGNNVAADESFKLSADERRQNALAQLESAKTKKVLFAVQTNMTYDARTTQDPPLPNAVVSFEVNEFLHIKMKYDKDWWIGRVIKEETKLGFIPTPAKLEALGLRCMKSRRQQNNKKAEGLPGFSATTGPFARKCFKPMQRSSKLLSGTAYDDGRSKKLFKRQKFIPVYDLVPCMRPVILVGPSLKGFEITDKMHTAVLDFIKVKFKDRVSIVRVGHDISVAKKSKRSNPTKQAELDKAFLKHNHSDIQCEIERIHNIAQSLKLLILDADCIDHPNQLKNSCLAPLIVALKISSPKVLNGLIKKVSTSPARSVSSQLAAADKLNKCSEKKFDIVLDNHELDHACSRLEDFLEDYLKTVAPSHPVESLNVTAEKHILSHMN